MTDLEDQLKRSVDATERGRFVLREDLPTEAQLIAIHAQLKRLITIWELKRKRNLYNDSRYNSD